MLTLPFYIHLVFIITTFITFWFFYRASNYSKAVLFVSAGWLLLQAIAALSGFYLVTDSIPPRFILLVPPTLVLIIILFLTNKGKIFIDDLDLQTLTWLHIVRVPVELVLFLLYVYKSIPELMTFEGRNFDILSGLSAPFVALLAFRGGKSKKKLLLYWNFICILLLLNIVINAVLSAPSPFQQFAFDQPNVGIFYFPYVWLPCYIVPVVLFSHLAAIRQLTKLK